MDRKAVVKGTLTHKGKRSLTLPSGRLLIGDVLSLHGSRPSIIVAGLGGFFVFDQKPQNAGSTWIEREQLPSVLSLRKRKFLGAKFRDWQVIKPPSSLLKQVLIPWIKRDVFKKDETRKLRLLGATNVPGFNWVKEVSKLLQEAKDRYYGNGDSDLTDEEYDFYEALLTEADPKNPILKKIGALPADRKVELPVPMYSLNKRKSGTEGTKEWLAEHTSPQSDVFLSGKADGISSLLKYQDERFAAAYTRGDGEYGQIITPHMKCVPNVPETCPGMKGTWYIRGEVVMPIPAFKKYFADEMANPRNMVAGLLNAKEIKVKALQQCQFLAHIPVSVKHPNTPKKQLQKISRWFTTVPYIEFGPSQNKGQRVSDIDDALLVRMLANMRDGQHELDGLVVTISDPSLHETRNGNPKYSVAFKDNAQSFIATVGKVEWRTSRYGVLKPRVKLKKGVKHLGVTIQHATAHNAGFVRDNGIGPGAQIEMIRSGDVIPYIVRVIRPVKPQLPPDPETWEWTETGVDIVLKSKAGDPIKAAAYFFAHIRAENINEGVVSRLFDAGYDTIPKILNASPKQMMEAEGIQQRMAEKVWNNIHDALDGIDLPLLASASAAFGRGMGYERLQRVWQQYGNEMFNWAGYKRSEIVDQLTEEIEGFGVIVAKQFASNVKDFVTFYKSIRKHVTLNKYRKPKVASSKLKDMSFCFTGVRDSDLEQLIVKHGGRVSGSVADGLTVLIAKDPGSASAKASKARSLGIPIMSLPQFQTWLKKKGVE